MGRWGLVVEYVVLFVVLPLGFRFRPFPFPVIPALWVLSAYCLYKLLQDPAFDRSLLGNWKALRHSWLRIILMFGGVALLIAVCVLYFEREKLFLLVKQTPWIWALVMVLYPVLSVYPQGVVYRAFLVHRYRGLFPHQMAMVAASAVAFSFAHIVFHNTVAVVLTFAGGALFAWRYCVGGSLVASAFEHALYGCWMFTVGLGEFFYRGLR